MFVLLPDKHDDCCFSLSVIEIYLMVVYCSENLLLPTAVVTGEHIVTVKVKN